MLSLRAKYALRAMIHLAEVGGTKPQSVTSIAEGADVPRAFLEQILSDLKRRDLLISQRGKQGGFLLARAPDAISFADIIRHIDGPLALAPCASQTAFHPCPECPNVKTCPLRKTLIAVRDASAEILEHTSLADAARGGKRSQRSQRSRR